MAHELVTGTAPPPSVRKKEVIRHTSREWGLFVVLSSSAWGVDTHWDGRRTEECFKPKQKDCPGCKRGLPGRWKCYLHVTNGSKTWDGFLELTAAAWAMLEAQIPNKTSLRGLMIRLKKSSGGPKGRYIVEVLERVLEPDCLENAEDPYPTLRFLWGCKRPVVQKEAS
jgi:hypothetical protein